MQSSVNRERFLQHLRASKDTVWQVARWLNEKGNIVTINPGKECGDSPDWERYVDMGDLTIAHRTEVKGLSADFTCRENWPFAHFIVCAKHSWDNATPRPYAYFYVNRARTHVAAVMGHSAPHWYVQMRSDKRYENHAQAFYFCPLELVRFSPLALDAQRAELSGADGDARLA